MQISTQQLFSVLCGLQSQLSSLIDSEAFLMCTPEGTPVIVRARFSAYVDTATTIPIDAWTLDGAKYTGDLTALVICTGGV